MSKRSFPSIYSEEYQEILDRVNAARTAETYHKACQELLIYVDLHIDGIRAVYEERGGVRPYQAGTEVYCMIEENLVRKGRVYGHRLTEVSGQEPKLEYLVHLFFEGDAKSSPLWKNAEFVHDKAEDAFK